jgi:phage terminase large subunit-like protein
MKKREEMKSKNMSFNAFEQELRNKPIAEEERQFKWEWLNNPLRRIPLDTLLKTGKTLVGYATVDAAESMADGADSTASIVALIDPDMNWYIVDVRNEKRNIKDLVLLPFQLWEKWSKHGLIKVGVERKAFDDQLAPLLEDKRREMSGIYPVIEELKPMGRAKEARILGALQGRFELGRIWFCTDASGRLVGDTEKLIHQLYDFPASAHDDLSDALAYVSDIAKTPMQGERFPTPARNPSDDPWAADEWTGVRPIQSGVIEGMPHDVEEDAFL